MVASAHMFWIALVVCVPASSEAHGDVENTIVRRTEKSSTPSQVEVKQGMQPLAVPEHANVVRRMGKSSVPAKNNDQPVVRRVEKPETTKEDNTMVRRVASDLSARPDDEVRRAAKLSRHSEKEQKPTTQPVGTDGTPVVRRVDKSRNVARGGEEDLIVRRAEKSSTPSQYQAEQGMQPPAAEKNANAVRRMSSVPAKNDNQPVARRVEKPETAKEEQTMARPVASDVSVRPDDEVRRAAKLSRHSEREQKPITHRAGTDGTPVVRRADTSKKETRGGEDSLSVRRAEKSSTRSLDEAPAVEENVNVVRRVDKSSVSAENDEQPVVRRVEKAEAVKEEDTVVRRAITESKFVVSVLADGEVGGESEEQKPVVRRVAKLSPPSENEEKPTTQRAGADGTPVVRRVDKSRNEARGGEEHTSVRRAEKSSTPSRDEAEQGIQPPAVKENANVVRRMDKSNVPTKSDDQPVVRRAEKAEAAKGEDSMVRRTVAESKFAVVSVLADGAVGGDSEEQKPVVRRVTKLSSRSENEEHATAQRTGTDGTPVVRRADKSKNVIPGHEATTNVRRAEKSSTPSQDEANHGMQPLAAEENANLVRRMYKSSVRVKSDDQPVVRRVEKVAATREEETMVRRAAKEADIVASVRSGSEIEDESEEQMPVVRRAAKLSLQSKNEEKPTTQHTGVDGKHEEYTIPRRAEKSSTASQDEAKLGMEPPAVEENANVVRRMGKSSVPVANDNQPVGKVAL